MRSGTSDSWSRSPPRALLGGENMSRRFGFALLVSGVFSAAVVTVSFASSSGADPGLSGGPEGYDTAGGNCAACHEFNQGGGGVELIGAPSRFIPGRSYDVGVRVFDPEQAGAGFEVSVESPTAQVGALSLVDALRTQFASRFNEFYITHTSDGYDDTLANWLADGGAATYEVRWTAPVAPTGRAWFFASGNAVNDANAIAGDRYYHTYAPMDPAIRGDADGDEDVDLKDFATLQSCMATFANDPLDPCAFVDLAADTQIDIEDIVFWDSVVTGPVATLPPAYFRADPVRGGVLYDKWWKVSGAAEPVGEHPLYPNEGPQSGSTTFRCKECHGWDYAGADGAYGAGSHFTGIAGVLGTNKTPAEIVALLLASESEIDGGHDMDAFGLTERDAWDLARFVDELVVDTSPLIDEFGAFAGNELLGNLNYGELCLSCHGSEGDLINFGTDLDPRFVGTEANGNPWEFLHKARFGHPGSPMPSMDLLGRTPAQAAEVGKFAQTLTQ